MRKKPILFNRIKYKDMSRITVGIMGTHPGVGVTYTSLMLAFYMGEELGKKTALLEVNNHQDMSILQKVYQWFDEDNNGFSFRNITCYKNVTKNSMTDILSENYECFILDFGSDFNNFNNQDEFTRCGTKMIIGSQAEWNLYKLKKFVKSVQNIRDNESWLYLIPYGEPKVIKMLRKELNKAIFRVPLELDPIMISRESLKLFRMLFHKTL